MGTVYVRRSAGASRDDRCTLPGPACLPLAYLFLTGAFAGNLAGGVVHVHPERALFHVDGVVQTTRLMFIAACGRKGIVARPRLLEHCPDAHRSGSRDADARGMRDLMTLDIGFSTLPNYGDAVHDVRVDDYRRHRNDGTKAQFLITSRPPVTRGVRHGRCRRSAVT